MRFLRSFECACGRSVDGRLAGSADRIQPGKPFLKTGVDYAGPFYCKLVDRDGSAVIVMDRCICLYEDSRYSFGCSVRFDVIGIHSML